MLNFIKNEAHFRDKNSHNDDQINVNKFDKIIMINDRHLIQHCLIIHWAKFQ